MTPYIMGLIHELKAANIVEKDNQNEGKEMCAKVCKLLAAVAGIQQTQNPRTVARRNRDAWISCALKTT